MRSVPLVLLVVGALLGPAAALAGGGATTPPSRSFVITGLVLGDRTIEASGKLAIAGGQLIASVGCNTIGGAVTLDGDTVTIPQPLVTTDMACLGVNGDSEAMLIKILQSGPFTISSRAWTGVDAAVLVEEVPSGPGPGASFAPPDDGVVSSSFVPGTVEPAVSCPPVPVDVNGTSPGEAPPGAGSASSGDASSGSGGSSASDGSTGGGPAPAATAEDLPLPAATSIGLPAGTAATQPGVGTDPGVGKPLASDPCLDRMAAGGPGDLGGAGVEPPKTSDAAAERGSGLVDASALIPVAMGLVVLVVGFLTVRRIRATRSPS